MENKSNVLCLDLYDTSLLEKMLISKIEQNFEICKSRSHGILIKDIKSGMLSDTCFKSFEDAYEKAILHYCPHFYTKKLFLGIDLYGALLNFRSLLEIKSYRNLHVEYMRDIVDGQLTTKTIETFDGFVREVDFDIANRSIDLKYEPYYIILSKYLLEAIKCKNIDFEKALDIYVPFGLYSTR